MSAIDSAFDEEIIPQTHREPGGAQRGIQHKSGPSVRGTTLEPRSRINNKTPQNRPKTGFNLSNSGPNHG